MRKSSRRVVLFLCGILIFSNSIIFAKISQKAALKLLTGIEHFNDRMSIRIEAGNKIIYFDPFNIKYTNDADIIFITHTHFDHYDLDSIKQIKKSNTFLVIPSLGMNDACKFFSKSNIIEVKPGNSYTVDRFKFKTVPAYSISNNSHPKENSFVGYVLKINKYRYYLAGDTQLVPEIKKVKADVVFLPVDSTINMNVDNAVKLVKFIKPLVAVPVHDMSPNRVSFKSKEFVKKLLNTETVGIILRNN